MSDFHHSLEKVLGRVLDDNACGSVPTLNDLSEEMEREVRELAERSPVAALEYLQFHVRNAATEYAAPFIDEVLLSPESPVRTWGRRDLICHPRFELTTLLTLTIPEILEPVKLQEGERWYRVVPTQRDWRWMAMGAPGALVWNAPYWWEPTTDRCDTYDLDPELDHFEPITGLDIATRRWIASRVAWSLRGDYASIRTSDDVALRLDIDPGGLSEDAHVSIRGLLESYQPGDAGVPAFTGPDSMFSK